MPARFVRLLVVGMVVLPSTAHSTLPPAPGAPAAFAPRGPDAAPAFAPYALDAAFASEAGAPTPQALAGSASSGAVKGPNATDGGPEREACAKRESLRQLQGKIDPVLIRTAIDYLESPMGSGHHVSVKGRPYLLCLEPHYREPGSGPGPQGWHKGVTAYEAGE